MKTFTFICSAFLFTQSCNYSSFLSNMASPIVEGGINAIFYEKDAQFAQESLAAQLKLLEGFILNSPNNEEYLTYAAMGFASYAIGFVEDVSPNRAKAFYLRAKEYGTRALIEKGNFSNESTESLEQFKKNLNNYDEDDIPSIFWTALAWGLYINLSMDNMEAVADLGKVEVMMKYVKNVNPKYFGGGADLFFGVIECVKPPMLGGKPEKGLEHFKTALELSDNDFLLAKVFMIQYYCVATLNENLFDQWTKEVLLAPEPKNPKNNLPYALAKKKVQHLIKIKDELF